MTVPDEQRVVTNDDIRLVLDAMIRRETGALRIVGLAAEILGWAAFAASFVVAAARWDQVDGYSGAGSGVALWQAIAELVVPVFLSLAVWGGLLVVAGRGARLLACTRPRGEGST